MKFVKMKKIFKSPSILIISIIILFVVGVHNNQSPAKYNHIIKYDVISYYSYLPALFVEKDLSLGFINDANEKQYANENKYWPVKTSDGRRVIKTTMGTAVLYAPFFYVAHISSSLCGYASDGFSYPYQLAILASGLFYLFFGLFFLRKSLLVYFTENVTAATLSIIYFASNLLCYSTLQSACSHQYTFFLFSALIFSVIKWHLQINWKSTISIGLIIGLLSLVRIINILFILPVLLYNVHTLVQLKDRIGLMLKNYKFILAILLIAIFCFLPQIMYWKFISGHYFYNSYVGENFYFFKPHLAECLIGFRKGWLIYTPVFVFALIGVYTMYKRKHPLFLSLVILLPLYFYVVASWWCWWYGGSFGLRSMIDIYPLMAFSLAIFIETIISKSMLTKAMVVFLLLFFMVLNCFQTIQFHYNIINYDSMTFEAYKDRFFKITRANCDRTLLARPDYNKGKLGEDATIPYEGE